jgi:hypothetical protein
MLKFKDLFEEKYGKKYMMKQIAIKVPKGYGFWASYPQEKKGTLRFDKIIVKFHKELK